MANFDPIRRSAARLRLLLTIASLALLLILVLERLGYAGAYRRGGLDLLQLPAQLVLSLPALMDLGALWCLRGAAASAADGHPFGRVTSTAFRRVGALLTASALTGLFLVPVLAPLFDGQPERLIDADISTVVLGVIGIGMIFVGSLIDRAGAAERELEAFF